jgi:glucose-1-phosphate thymidylyltransferase
MKGIILSGGLGTRLGPLTTILSKQLLPIYDKPMVYYPLATLMLLGIKEVLLISSNEHIEMFRNLLGSGSGFGITIDYAVQTSPRGIAEAFLIGEEFIGEDNVCLILGDNVFYGQDFISQLSEKTKHINGALITGYRVNNPKEFGVVSFDSSMNVESLEEKPVKPKSNFAIPGLYFYDNTVVMKSKVIEPSQRGELEITTLNQLYLNDGNLKVHLLGRGVAWLDTGSPESLLSASEFVEVIQKRQGLYIACLEEIAWRKGFINLTQLEQLGHAQAKSDYGQYILRLVESQKVGQR